MALFGPHREINELIHEFGYEGAREFINNCRAEDNKPKKPTRELIVTWSCCFVCKHLAINKTKSGRRSFKCRRTNKQVIYQYKIPKWCPGFKINPNLG